MARFIPGLGRGVAGNLVFGVVVLSAQAPSAEEWRQLIETNRQLQAQVAAQQEQINALRAEVTGLVRADSRRADEIADLRHAAAPGCGRRAMHRSKLEASTGRIVTMQTGDGGRLVASARQRTPYRLTPASPVVRGRGGRACPA